MMDRYDVIVIGGGPAGLAAAASARRNGAEKVLLLERDDGLGGILNQCIHDGFGLRRYGKQLTGPEYAARGVREAKEAGVEFRTGCMVTDMTGDKVITAVSREGLEKLPARAVVLSTGCRERTRGTLSIPGPRPAGIYTAGVVQNLVNCRNIMPGKKAVILGSGDIGLIMARRLTLEGAEVLGVVEIMPEPGGLTRNVSQCVLDYGIPLYLEHTVSRIIGKKRLEAVEIAKVDGEKRVIPGTERLVACDTLVLSVGLIPGRRRGAGPGDQQRGHGRVFADQRPRGVLLRQLPEPGGFRGLGVPAGGAGGEKRGAAHPGRGHGALDGAEPGAAAPRHAGPWRRHLPDVPQRV